MYRNHAKDLEPPPDPEELAMREVGRRTTRLRGLTAGLGALIGQLIGMGGYLMLRQIQLEHGGAHVPLLTALVGYGPLFVGVLALSGWVGKLLVRQRAPAWVDELATRHQVSPARLREYMLIW